MGLEEHGFPPCKTVFHLCESPGWAIRSGIWLEGGKFGQTRQKAQQEDAPERALLLPQEVCTKSPVHPQRRREREGGKESDSFAVSP